MMPVYGALIGRLFGVEAFGQVMGLGALVGLPVITAAPVLFGLAFDQTGSYVAGLVGLVGGLGISIVLFALLPPGRARKRGAGMDAT
jgi:MFS-type transporter involved in bile tolerance (Atg22 family)